MCFSMQWYLRSKIPNIGVMDKEDRTVATFDKAMVEYIVTYVISHTAAVTQHSILQDCMLSKWQIKWLHFYGMDRSVWKPVGQTVVQ